MADQPIILMLIPHHDAAIARADLALSRSQYLELKALAQRLKTSQQQDNAQLRRWYRLWFGTEPPTWSWPGSRPARPGGMGGPGGMGMGMGNSSGWGTSLAALNNAPDFDRTFLEEMMAQHRMVVMMGSMAQIHSPHPELRQLAAAMVRIRGEEIQAMERCYRLWYPATTKG